MDARSVREGIADPRATLQACPAVEQSARKPFDTPRMSKVLASNMRDTSVQKGNAVISGSNEVAAAGGDGGWGVGLQRRQWCYNVW